VRLVTWNLNGRRRQLPDQLAALAARSPDIIALQEVTAGTSIVFGTSFPAWAFCMSSTVQKRARVVVTQRRRSHDITRL